MLAGVRAAKRARTPEEAIRALGRMREAVVKGGYHVEEYRHACMYLLEQFSVDWLTVLGEKERSIFNEFFSIPTSDRTLLTLSQALRLKSLHLTAKKVILRQIERFVEGGGIGGVGRAAVRETMAREERERDKKKDEKSRIGDTLPQSTIWLLHTFVSLPTLIANQLGSKTPKQFQTEPFLSRVLTTIISTAKAQIFIRPSGTCKNSAQISEKSSEAWGKILGELWSRLVLSGNKEVIGETLTVSLTSSTALTLFSHAFRYVRAEVTENVLKVVLTSLGKAKVDWAILDLLRGVLTDQTTTSVAARRAMIETFTLAKPLLLPAAQLHILVLRGLPRGIHGKIRTGVSVNIGENQGKIPRLLDDSMLGEALMSVASAWSKGGFVGGVGGEMQAYVTRFLQACVQAVAVEDTKRRTHPCIPLLMSGIQLRLDSLTPQTREEGMRIAEEFSKILDPTNPLDFRESPKPPESVQESTGNLEENSTLATETSQENPEKKDKKHLYEPSRPLNPLALPSPYTLPSPPSHFSSISSEIEKKFTEISKNSTCKKTPNPSTLSGLRELEEAIISGHVESRHVGSVHVENGHGDGGRGDDVDEQRDEEEEEDPDALFEAEKGVGTGWEGWEEGKEKVDNGSSHFSKTKRIVGFVIPGGGDEIVEGRRDGEGGGGWESLWGEDEEFEAMEETLKDDTSELREVPLPNLLISSLEHIQNTKSKPHMEAGVESLPQNLRGAADSMLDRLASILTRSLLHLWSVEVFDSDEHQKQAFLGLTTVMSKRPLLAYPMALRVICDKEHMLHQRTIALEAIEASAFTLANSPSGTGKEESSQEKRGNSRKWINVSNENKISPEAKRWEIIRARVEARASTRRWSRRRPAPKTSINRFGSVSMSVFAPLLAISLKIASGMRDNLRYSIHNGTAKPFEEGERTGDAHDRILFGSIIRCLGTLLSCAGRSAPGTWAMAQSLLDLLFITRFHPVKEIRRETLVALGKALQAVPPAILHNKMYGELVEVVEWLQDVCKIDPDSECREIATAVAALIQKSLKEAKMSISSRPIIRVGHARSGGILDIAKSGGAGTLALAELKSVTL